MRTKFGEHIQGWMTSQELDWLAQQAAKSHYIVEVGSWRGRSTTAIANHMLGELWCVDAWKGKLSMDDEAMYPGSEEEAAQAEREFLVNMKEHIAINRLYILKGSSDMAVDYLMANHGPVFDFIFIDADHSYEAVHHDIVEYGKLLQVGGILAGHDNWMPGVEQAVKELLPNATNVVHGIWSSVKI